MLIFYLILISTTIISALGCYFYSQKIRPISTVTGDVENTNLKRSISLFFAIASFFLMIFLISYRSSYGDTYLYIKTFDNVSNDLADIKPIIESKSDSKGFYILQILFKCFISDNYTVWFAFLAIFSAGAIIKVYYEHSINFTMSAFLFVTSGAFTWFMNGTRQFLAVCLILYGFNYLVKRKTVRFILIVLIATTIHASAILWIPIYFIVILKPWSKGIWLCVFATVLVIFFLDQFTSILDDSLQGTMYEGVGSMMNGYVMEDGTVDDGVNPIRLFISAVPAAIAFWRKKQVAEYEDRVINICINLSVVGTCIYLLGIFTSGIMVGRLPIYFTLTNYILLPWLIDKTLDNNSKSFIKIMCYLLYFLYFYYSYDMSGVGDYKSDKLGLYYH